VIPHSSSGFYLLFSGFKGVMIFAYVRGRLLSCE